MLSACTWSTAERIREQSASACRDNVGLLVTEARYQTAILSTCSERHVSAISDLNEPDRHIASAGAHRKQMARNVEACVQRPREKQTPSTGYRARRWSRGLGPVSRPFRGNTPFPMILPNHWKRTAERYLRGRRNVVDSTKKGRVH